MITFKKFLENKSNRCKCPCTPCRLLNCKKCKSKNCKYEGCTCKDDSKTGSGSLKLEPLDDKPRNWTWRKPKQEEPQKKLRDLPPPRSTDDEDENKIKR